jgi:hypothetical protein
MGCKIFQMIRIYNIFNSEFHQNISIFLLKRNHLATLYITTSPWMGVGFAGSNQIQLKTSKIGDLSFSGCEESLIIFLDNLKGTGSCEIPVHAWK